MLDKACGVDVHKGIFVAKITDGTTAEKARFENSLEGTENIKAWLRRARMQTRSHEVHGSVVGFPYT